jgi:hypothetical protein
MNVSWILSMLDAVGSLLLWLNLFRFWHDLKSCEPRAWLVLAVLLFVLWAAISFLRSTRRQVGRVRHPSHRSDLTWDRLDEE